MFQKAVKEKLKGRVAIVGPSGSGKTYTSLLFGSALAEGAGGRLAVIDTEGGSAKKYADRFDFDVMELTNFAPTTYTRAIREAGQAGYGAVLIDSLSHAWSGTGGALEMVDSAARRNKADNRFAGWRDVTPKHNEMIDAILRSPIHVLTTMRSKTAYEMQEYERDGRKLTRPVKIGLAPIQRDGVDYEFDLVCEMDADHWLTVTKSRCFEMQDRAAEKPRPEFLAPFVAWLDGGTARAPERLDIGVAPASRAPDGGLHVESQGLEGSLPPAFQPLNGSAHQVLQPPDGGERPAARPVPLTEQDRAAWTNFIKTSGTSQEQVHAALGTYRPTEWIACHQGATIADCIQAVITFQPA
jgi:hypothetical protein